MQPDKDDLELLFVCHDRKVRGREEHTTEWLNIQKVAQI